MKNRYIQELKEVYSKILVTDDSVVSNIVAAFNKLKNWFVHRYEAAERLVSSMIHQIGNTVTKSISKDLNKVGFGGKLKHSDTFEEALQASIAFSVAKIKTIPIEYHNKIENIVFLAIQSGENWQWVAKQITGVSNARAELIARDQLHKATQFIAMTRFAELGCEKARWRHSGIPKEPRPSHLHAGNIREIFSLKKGWYDPTVKKFIFPGELPLCLCYAEPILPPLGGMKNASKK